MRKDEVSDFLSQLFWFSFCASAREEGEQSRRKSARFALKKKASSRQRNKVKEKEKRDFQLFLKLFKMVFSSFPPFLAICRLLIIQ